MGDHDSYSDKFMAEHGLKKRRTWNPFDTLRAGIEP
jgi:hypothetical protein